MDLTMTDAVVIAASGLLGVLVGPTLTEIVEHAPNRERVAVSLRPTAVAVLDRDRRRTRDLAIRVLAPLLLMLAAARWGASVAVLPYLVLYAALLVLSAIDIEHHRLPDNVVFPTFAAVATLMLVASTVLVGPGRITPALVGAAVYFVLLAVPWFVYPKGLGFGDVKLAAVLGLSLGWIYDDPFNGVALVLYSLIIACIIGVITGVSISIVRRKRAEFPFGPALALGCIAMITFSDTVLPG